jgi:hypothetical protein
VVEQLGIGRLGKYAFDSFCLGTSNNLGTNHLFQACALAVILFLDWASLTSLPLSVSTLVVSLLLQLG